MVIDLKDRITGCLLGVIIGDALGYPYEGKRREFVRKEPIKGFKYEKHIFSDDSSLTLCTIDALIANGYNLKEIANTFLKWFNNGYWSANNRGPIGIGRGTVNALKRLKKLNLLENPVLAGNKTELSNGNGSLMRMSPIPMYSFQESDEVLLQRCQEVSSITHAHPRSIIACGIYSLFLKALLLGKKPVEAYNESVEISKEYYTKDQRFVDELKYFQRIFSMKLPNLIEDEIESSGYVIDSLEASLWCSFQFNSFTDMILCAVNLGGDTDTIGAITGSIAGVIYGKDSIAEEWLTKIVKIDEIIPLITEFVDKLTGKENVNS